MRRILTFFSWSLPLNPHVRSRSVVDFNSDNVARQNYWLKHAKLYFNFKTTSMSNKIEYLIDCLQSPFSLKIRVVPSHAAYVIQFLSAPFSQIWYTCLHSNVIHSKIFQSGEYWGVIVKNSLQECSRFLFDTTFNSSDILSRASVTYREVLGDNRQISYFFSIKLQ